MPQPAARRRAPTRRNRVYAAPEKLRAAYLAGQGKTAEEIAQVIGGTTPRKVRDMLRSSGIDLARPFGRPRALLVYLTLTDAKLLGDMAADRDVAAADLARELLSIIAAEPVLAANLLDEGRE
jgi:hypothetical protein